MKRFRFCLAVSLFLAVVIGCAPRVVTPKGALQPIEGVGPEELEGAYAPKKMALIIGVGQFDNSRWKPLKYPGKDAEDLASALMDPELGGFDDVRVLSSPEETDKSSILAAMDELAGKNTNPRDTVVVYFSGHGTLERDGGGNLRQYLVARDTEFDNIPGTAIDCDDLRARFSALKSRRKALILASCHSGQGKSELNARMSEELRHTKAAFFVKPFESVSEASVILSASAWGETAREDDRLGNDIYTHFLLEALGKYDPNEDGAVTVSEAHDYAREKTYYYTNGQQRPTALSDIMGADPIVLSGKVSRRGKPAIYSYSDSMSGVRVIIDGVPKGKLPGSVVVQEGVHRVEIVGPENDTRLFDRKVALRTGLRVNVKSLIKKVNIDRSAGAGTSYRAFFSGDVNEGLAAPMLMYGGAYSRPGVLNHTVLVFGLYGGNESQSLKLRGVDYDAQMTRIDLEGALLWQYRRGKLSLMGGPLAGMIYFDSRTDSYIIDSSTLATGMAGLKSALQYAVLPQWALKLDASVYSALLLVDNQSVMEPGYAATFSLAYRF